jgi:hypothetical protein
MTVIRGAPRLVVGAPRLVAGAPSYSEGRQECPPRVWYSPEIDAFKFTLHILSHTPGGSQWLKYILLMLCNATHCLGDGKRVIHSLRVRGSVRAVWTVRNTGVFLTETNVVANETRSEGLLYCRIPPSHLETLPLVRICFGIYSMERYNKPRSITIIQCITKQVDTTIG